MARLLLVDDDIAEISAVKRVLARAGHSPLLATNASDAVAAVTQRRPDLVLVGATCENGDALAAMARLAEDPNVGGLTLIVLGQGGLAPASAVQLPRPIDPTALAEAVQAALERPAAPPQEAPRAAPLPPAPAPPPAPTTTPPPRSSFERRGPTIELPLPLERRAQPTDPTNARRAAAEALRARAEELRRAPEPLSPGPSEAAAGLDALFELEPPAGVELPQADAAAPIVETPLDLPEERDLTESLFEPAPEVEQAEAVEGAMATPAPPARTEPSPPLSPAPGSLLEEAEERARAEESLRAEVEAARAREAEARAALEAQARAEAARRAEEEAARARDAEGRALVEARARAEAARRAEEEATRARDAEAQAREEAEARRELQVELDRLKAQLDADRQAHQSALLTERQRTAAEVEVAARQREQEVAAERQRALQSAADETLRRAVGEAEARATLALEAMQARVEAEAAKREEAEAAVTRLTEESARLTEESARLTEATSRLTAERSALTEAAARAAGLPAPAPASGPARFLADLPPLDEAQEAARRRALSLRARRDPEPGLEPEVEPVAETPLDLPPEPEPLPAPPPAELRAGALDDLPAPRLLALAARAGLGGRLDVTGEATRSLWFEAGRVVGAASNEPSERIEEVALRLGLLTRVQHRQLSAAVASLATRRAALLLVERGYVKPAELTTLVRRRTEEVVFALFGEVGARYRWVPDPVPADERIAPDRPPLALAVEGVRRRWLQPRAEEVLGGPASLLAPAQGAPSATELGLAPEERRTLALADGLRSLDEVLAESPLDPLSTRQLLAAAVLTGALTVRVVQPGRPAAQVEAAIDLARVKEKLEQVRRADYFTILGVGRLATPHEVREAAGRLLAEFELARYQGAREEGLPARLEEIRRVVADAREVLADDALRAEYVRGLDG